MKVRIKVPEEIALRDWRSGRHIYSQIFVDDILLWGMETELDIAFYSYWYDSSDSSGSKFNHSIPQSKTGKYAVFTVEDKYSYMFSLKWGATLHKPQHQPKEIY